MDRRTNGQTEGHTYKWTEGKTDKSIEINGCTKRHLVIEIKLKIWLLEQALD